MRIAVCLSDNVCLEQIEKWLGQYCILYNLSPEIIPFASPLRFFEESSSRHFDIAFMGFGGPQGYHDASRLRDEDKTCKIVLIDDTPAYAVRGVRLHFTDFILRPVEFKQIVRAMKLAGY